MKYLSKLWRPITVVTCVVGLVATAAYAVRPNPTTLNQQPGKKLVASDETRAPAQTAGTTLYIQSVGFEPGEGYAPGFINDQPCAVGPTCWGITTAAGASDVEGHVDTVHPFAGTQHFRLSPDPNHRTNQPGFGLGVDARLPASADTVTAPIGTTVFDMEVSVDTPFGQDFQIQPQAISQSARVQRVLFFYAGGLYMEDLAPTQGYYAASAGWDTSGAYQHLKLTIDACNNDCTEPDCFGTTTLEYAGAEIYKNASGTWAGTAVDQFLVYGDNYPGSSMDIDDLVANQTECVTECGNGVIEVGEDCEVGDDSPCPGRCIGVGEEGECTCTRVCTLADPCILENGTNGPFNPPCDASFGCIFLYDGTGIPSVSLETCGTDFDTVINYWGSANDVNDPGNANDDCESSGCCFAGSDPSSSCYDNDANFESCTCHSLPGYPDDTLWIAQVFGVGGEPAGGNLIMTVNKKAVCGEGHLGSCCDTNGGDTGCTDGVLEADCSGADKVWTENGKCADVTCECIPDCSGRECGDDGCGGSCGECDDGNVCNGTESCDGNGQCLGGTPLSCSDGNACNGVETCNPASGCQPGTPLVCDDGVFCNGVETCSPASGCQSGNSPCAENEVCDEDNDRCNPTSIPTVSEWGLVILTLLLLTGAKVYFSRRQVIA